MVLTKSQTSKRGRTAGSLFAAAALIALGVTADAASAFAQSRSPRRAAARPVHDGVGSLAAALRQAFNTNPDIRAQRSQVRATQELIPQARAGLLPQVSATTYAGVLATRSQLAPGSVPNNPTLYQRGVALTATQTLFDGWRTQNATLQAQQQVGSQREQMRAIEQSVMLDVATTYLAVFTGQALVEVQRRNVGFLTETLATTRTRLASGVATPTDVSQAEARLSRGQSDLSAAQTDLSIARDRFLRLVGAPPATQLAAVPSVDRLLPPNREASRQVAGESNPAVLAAISTVRAAEAAVRVAQGSMLPQVTLQGQAARDFDVDATTRRTDSVQVVGRVTVPLYAGGAPEASVRQSRELLGVAQAQLDGARLQSRSAAYAGHAALDNATFTIRAATAEVRAAEVTVDGVRKQYEAGLRTLTELLNAQQDTVSARARLLQAQSDRLVASYTVLAATGRLDLGRLGIGQPPVISPPPQSDLGVRIDAWGELRNPTGPARPPSGR